MPREKIAAAEDHLARMVGTRAVLGLAELVWNAVDANASRVEVEIKTNPLGSVDEVVVTDDGHGFGTDEIPDLFGHVGGSWKHHAPHRKTRNGMRLLHGDKGEGRWKAFSVGDRVIWESVTPGTAGGPNQKVRLVMSQQNLDEYDWAGPEVTNLPTGTTARIVAGTRQPNALLTDKAPRELTSILALYLTKYPDVLVTYNGDALEINELIARRDEIAVPFDNQIGPVAVTVLEWDTDIDRALYLCDDNGATLHEAQVKIHAPGFNFTAYLRWAGFRVHESLLPMSDWGNHEVGLVVEAAREALRQHFRSRRTEEQKTIVQGWREENVYPYPEDPTDPVEQAEQALFNYVAVTASDAVNRIDDQTAKALSLRAIRVAVERDPSSIEFIFQEILKLPADKIEEFRQLLERTSLPALVDAMRLVTGRLEFLAGLEMLLFDPAHAPKVLERAHLHKMIENEPWLFGEEFSMHVSDRGLTALLEAHIGLLGRDELVTEAVTDDEGKPRRIDFLFGRALELNRNRREHLVVEIKKPSVVAGRTEIEQIEDYAAAVSGDPRFDIETVTWDFILMTTDLDERAQARATEKNRPRGLIHEGDNGLRIWVKRWNEIIAECKHRLRFVRDQLKYDPADDQAIAYLRERYPHYLPAHLSADADEAIPSDDPTEVGTDGAA